MKQLRFSFVQGEELKPSPIAEEAGAFIAQQLGEEKTIKVRPFKDKNNKWIARSALQKAIRRGVIDQAVHVAGQLIADDEQYFWYSMSIIMIEDIGFANPDLCFFSTMMARGVTFRSGIDQPRMAEAMIRSACLGQKTRVCCEVSLACELAGKAWRRAVTAEPVEDTVESISAALAAPQPYTVDGMYSLYCRLLCIANKNKTKRLKEEFAPAVQEFMKINFSEKHARAAMTCLMHPFDGMHVAYAASLPLTRLSFVELKEEFPPEITLRSLSSAAFDVHTRQGKLALKGFYTSLRKKYPILGHIDEQRATKAIGAVVFVLEGEVEVRRLFNKTMEELKDGQDMAYMEFSGVPKADIPEVMSIVLSEIPLLNSKREWAVKLEH